MTDIVRDSLQAIRLMCEDPANRRSMTLKQACLLLDVIRGQVVAAQNERLVAEPEREGLRERLNALVTEFEAADYPDHWPKRFRALLAEPEREGTR